MMKQVVVLAALALAACEAKVPEDASPAAATPAEQVGEEPLDAMLASGDGAACASAETKATILEIVNMNQPIVLPDQVTADLDMVTLESTDTATGKMTCRGTLAVAYEGEPTGSGSMVYTLQPSVQGDSVVIYIQDIRNANFHLQNALARAREEDTVARNSTVEARERQAAVQEQLQFEKQQRDEAEAENNRRYYTRMGTTVCRGLEGRDNILPNERDKAYKIIAELEGSQDPAVPAIVACLREGLSRPDAWSS
jgi:hypothetical protein